MFRRVLRPARRLPLWLVLPVGLALLLEASMHVYRLRVPRPPTALDAPFFTACQEPDASAPRASAALVMLARNAELEAARRTVASVDRAFNRFFDYPIVFMNDEPWDARFVAALNETARGLATFEVVPRDVWSFPDWIDPDAARRSIKSQGERGFPHGESEGYHHMCRFYSGKFYQMDFLKKYKWYWRLEPDVDFPCTISYDPFVQMARHNKVYGFTMALWEVGKTCPSLFRHAADWKELYRLPTNNLWRAMISASWMPFPFRRLLNPLAYRDRFGDPWSLCHYWSNFEIADMDVFRSKAYQDFFDYLDKKGGFYFERWGDAAVHSLAVAMFVEPEKVHHFEDLGYRHGDLYQCPANAPGGQLPSSALLGKDAWTEEKEGGIGCRCKCDGRQETRNFGPYCLDKLKQPNTPRLPWSKRLS